MSNIVINVNELNQWAYSQGIPSPIGKNGIAFSEIQDLPEDENDYKDMIAMMLEHGYDKEWVKAFDHYEIKDGKPKAWTSYYIDIPIDLSIDYEDRYDIKRA